MKNLVLIIKYIKGSMEQYLNSFYMSILRGKRTYTEESILLTGLSPSRTFFLFVAQRSSVADSDD